MKIARSLSLSRFVSVAAALCLCSLWAVASANECTDACDAKYAGIGAKIRFCGTDGVSHETYYESVRKHCYFDCGVAAQYAGRCDCPNDCYAELSRGVCDANKGRCECAMGWGGEDCSLPTFGHDCSLHGQLVPSQYSPTGSVCACDDGFTGSDCSAVSFSLGAAPWADLFPEDGKQYPSGPSADPYGDAHPLYNLSNLPSLHVRLSQEDLLYQLDPVNCYNATYVPASLFFDANAGPSSPPVQEFFGKIGLRIKGAWSRMDLKKGFSLKLDEYLQDKQLFGTNKLLLKPGADDDDTFVKNILYTDLQRAVGVPVQRASYVLLYVNSRFQGLYIMHEDVDKQFIKGRVEDDKGKGNLFKLCHDVNLRYYGDDVSVYQNTLAYYPNGEAYHAYELASSKTDDWSDLVALLAFASTSSDADFAAEVQRRVHVPTLLRGLVVESFLLGADGFIKGQNYYLYHRDSPSFSDQWTLFNNDFDQEFYSDTLGKFKDDTNIFTFVRKPVGNGDYNPLLDRLFALREYTDLYAKYYQTFITQTFGSKSAQLATQRFTALYGLVLPWVTQDKMWQISEGADAQRFIMCAQNTTANLAYRYRDAWKQIQNYWQNKK